jgi:pyruvate formate-lyase activating enzyme-like uncharacterized protein
MPRRLKTICEAARQLQQEKSTLDTLRLNWQAYVSQAEQQIDGIRIEADGEILYLGDLSPGCRTCKEGTWDCIFVTMECNLACPFCYSPHAIPRDYAGSIFGATPAQIAENQAKTHITGVSFSGGEPFLNPQRLFDWLAWFKSRYPDKYYWLYTNGLLAGESYLQRLGKLGLDEIRFNLAATGYDHPTVMGNVAVAARFIPNITVEVPAIPEHTAKLLSCLEKWGEVGVKFLNLHELMYEPGTNSASMAGERQPIVTPDGHHSALNPKSRALTLAVMQRVQDEGLPLSVNDCSLQSKFRQLRGRRRSLTPLTKAPYEELVGDEVYESYCAYRGEEVYFFHPDTLPEMRQRYPDYQFVRLVRTAPLAVQDEGRWIAFERL